MFLGIAWKALLASGENACSFWVRWAVPEVLLKRILSPVVAASISIKRDAQSYSRGDYDLRVPSVSSRANFVVCLFYALVVRLNISILLLLDINTGNVTLCLITFTRVTLFGRSCSTSIANLIV